MHIYVVSYVMHINIQPFKGVSTKDVIDGDINNKSQVQNPIAPNYHGGQEAVNTPPGYDVDTAGSNPGRKPRGRYGIDKFRVSWHMNIPVSIYMIAKCTLFTVASLCFDVILWFPQFILTKLYCLVVCRLFFSEIYEGFHDKTLYTTFFLKLR